MLIRYHKLIIRAALSDEFSPHALDAILAANLRQDNLHGQIGHNEYHYDNNAIQETNHYLEEQRRLTVSALAENDLPSAWAAFGRLTHTAQDFYAHTNYIGLYLSRFNGQTPPPPSEVDPFMAELVSSPDLRSGKLYYPLELFSFIPGIKHLVIPLLPKDSHAHMHLDSPARGVKFEYAFEAAVKRTKMEFETIRAGIPEAKLIAFCGHEN